MAKTQTLKSYISFAAKAVPNRASAEALLADLNRFAPKAAPTQTID